MEFFDTHAHLDLLDIAADVAIENAKSENVKWLMTVSTDEKSWSRNEAIASQFENVYFSVGIHPHEAKNFKSCHLQMETYFKKKPAKCLAIGELGLDYHYSFSSKEDQIDAIEKQFYLAKALNLPVIIHCREAFNDIYHLVKKHSVHGVMHCFTGNSEQAKEGVNLGLYVSFSGILTFKNASLIREAAKAIPLTSIVLETDCPYLAPEPKRGVKNVPSLLPYTALKLSQVLNLQVERVAEFTTQNAMTLFGLSDKVKP